MKYILLQAPKEEHYLGQIEIIDNLTALGKEKEEQLRSKGYTPCGFIESDLQPTDLKYGFRSDADRQIDRLHNARRSAISELTLY